MDTPLSAPIAVRLNEAARMLGLSRRSIELLVADGRLPSRKLGRARVIRVADLHRLLRADLPHLATPPSADSAEVAEAE